MTGYTDLIVRRDYPKLGEEVFVEYRNPMTAPADMLSADEVGTGSQRTVNYTVIAKLLRRWHIPDATVEEGDVPLLEGPATADMVGRIPGVIVRDIMTDVAEALTGPR